MGSRQERANEQQHRKRTRNLIISIIMVLVIMIGGGVFTFYQLGRQDKIDTQEAASTAEERKTDNTVSNDEYEEYSVSSSSVESVNSEIVDETTNSQSDEITEHEKDMLFRRQMIRMGVDRFLYDRNQNTSKFMYMTEIPNGFTLYYDGGITYNVRDMGYMPNIDSKYDFGEKHGWEVYFNHTPAVQLEIPTNIGDPYVGREIPEKDLEQYAIR